MLLVEMWKIRVRKPTLKKKPAFGGIKVCTACTLTTATEVAHHIKIHIYTMKSFFTWSLVIHLLSFRLDVWCQSCLWYQYQFLFYLCFYFDPTFDLNLDFDLNFTFGFSFAFISTLRLILILTLLLFFSLIFPLLLFWLDVWFPSWLCS